MDITAGATMTEDGSGDHVKDNSMCTFNEHKGLMALSIVCSTCCCVACYTLNVAL